MPTAIPLPSDTELPDEIRRQLAALPPLNVFRMAAHAPASFRPLLDMATSVLVGAELDPRAREIAVLRVAHVTGSRYEWVQHVRLARSLGVTEREIEAVRAPGPVATLDAEGNLLCRVADEISRDVRLSDAALADLLARYGVRRTTELIFCCSYFNMLSRFLESTRVPLEETDVLGGRTPETIAAESRARARERS